MAADMPVGGGGGGDGDGAAACEKRQGHCLKLGFGFDFRARFCGDLASYFAFVENLQRARARTQTDRDILIKL